jgi:hypothetical protein
MKNGFFYIVLLMSFLFIGCDSNDDQENSSTGQYEISEEILYVDHYKSRCTAYVDDFCLRMRGGTESDWESDIRAISNFAFEWGYRYKVRVRRVFDTSPDICCNPPKYTLLNLLEKEAVGPGYLFDLHVVTGGRGEITKWNGSYFYGDIDGKEFVCSPEICSVLDSLIEQKLNILLEMRYQESPDDPMVVAQIKCSAAFENYVNDCMPSD